MATQSGRILVGALDRIVYSSANYWAAMLSDLAVLHRWVLHGPASMVKRGHAQHHAEPRVLISTPLFLIMTGALAIWGLLGLSWA